MTASNNTLKIATRQSPLALWQAEHVQSRLLALYPALKVELVTFVTKGDKILDVPLAKIGGKGLFVKELEQALFAGEADIAVHSTKDLPMQLPAGLAVPVYLQREDPTDAFVSNQYASIDELPHGAVVGTSSLRRQTQLQAYRADLTIKSLRGNVGTRLAKLDAGDYDAIILASSGLKRLGLQARIKTTLPIALSLPAVGQGALAIEMRENDAAVLEKIQTLNCAKTSACVLAERAMNRKLEGGCQVPIGGHATLSGGQLHLQGLVANADGSVILRANASGHAEEAEKIGMAVAADLLEQGAAAILAAFYDK